MLDILSLYSDFINQLLSFRIPGVNVSWGSLLLGIVAILLGSRMASMLFGAFSGSIKRLSDAKSRERFSNFKKKG